MITMCPPGNHRNGFVATHVPKYMITTIHCGDNLEGTLF